MAQTKLPHPGWLTNSPEAAKALKAADHEYMIARAACSGWKLADKVEAVRKAKAAHCAAYEAVWTATTGRVEP
jgi:hypothetical protein